MPKNTETTPATMTSIPAKTDNRLDTQNLSVRYGKIGIPAVAAALRYCDTGKPAMDAPVARNDQRHIVMAA